MNKFHIIIKGIIVSIKFFLKVLFSLLRPIKKTKGKLIV